MSEISIGTSGFWVSTPEQGDLFYSPSSDSIHVFPDHPELNHVHYWDEERRRVVWQFMGQAAMDTLHELGLPHTVRDSITPQEYEAWENCQVAEETAQLNEELDNLLGGSDGAA